MRVLCSRDQIPFPVSQRTSVTDMPGTDMDGRSIYDIDRSPFSFTGMASTMPEAMRAAKMLDILMVKCFTATKVQRLINCFGGYLHRFLAWLCSFLPP